MTSASVESVVSSQGFALIPKILVEEANAAVEGDGRSQRGLEPPAKDIDDVDEKVQRKREKRKFQRRARKERMRSQQQCEEEGESDEDTVNEDGKLLEPDGMHEKATSEHLPNPHVRLFAPDAVGGERKDLDKGVEECKKKDASVQRDGQQAKQQQHQQKQQQQQIPQQHKHQQFQQQMQFPQHHAKEHPLQHRHGHQQQHTQIHGWHQKQQQTWHQAPTQTQQQPRQQTPTQPQQQARQQTPTQTQQQQHPQQQVGGVVLSHGVERNGCQVESGPQKNAPQTRVKQPGEGERRRERVGGTLLGANGSGGSIFKAHLSAGEVQAGLQVGRNFGWSTTKVVSLESGLWMHLL